jgi:large subunit ribosomal protein L23
MALLNLFSKKEPTKKHAPKKKAQVEAVEVAPQAAVIASTSPVLRGFHVSEKSSQGFSMNQYTFIVDPKATKTEVRDAVKRSYKVDVLSVNMVRLPSKTRTVGRYRGTVAGKKKAIVTIKAGQTIAAAQS